VIFTSPRFVAFLAVLLAVLAFLGPRPWKLRILAVASCFFYAAWDWRYLGLLLFVSVVDYWAAWKINLSAQVGPRKAWLLLSIISNLGVLGCFKYYNFFIENFNYLLEAVGLRLPAVDVLLPAGISFYTFKTMSYTIDVYRRQLEPCRSWLNYATFITFFPELIAGPIVRASVFLPQMDRDIGPTSHRLLVGVSLFIQGLLKKLLIADRLAVVADPIFNSPQTYSAVTLWCGVAAYTIQIYCDFSGYSDMAIGTAKMIGYDLPENFRMPYLSANITEFWRRWHITLSNWLRDYLYIPLGGNRNGTLGTYRNLMVTMLLGGLWHGASWNFVLWGGLHGVGLGVHKWWHDRNGGLSTTPPWTGRLLTLLFVMVLWVPFRAQNFESTWIMLGGMFGVSGQAGGVWWPEWLAWCTALMVLGHLVGWNVERLSRGQCASEFWRKVIAGLGLKIEPCQISGAFLRPDRVSFSGIYLFSLLLLIMFYFAPMNTNPFIYFQF